MSPVSNVARQPAPRFKRTVFAVVWGCAGICTGIWTASGTEAAAEDRIILRSLDVISDQRVVSVSVEGVELGDRRQIGWDEIERISVDGPLNTKAQRLLGELGPPLFRIRQRMTVGDYSGLRDLAKQVQSRFEAQIGPSSLMVSQARVWGCLLEGQRAEALLGHFDTCRQLKANPDLAKTLPGKRAIAIDAATGLSSELQPIWFDKGAAKQIYPQAIQQAGAIPAPRPPGIYYYCASLALTVNEKEMAARMMSALPQTGRGLHWRWILKAQQETLAGEAGVGVQQLQAEWQSLRKVDQPLALYWLAKNELTSGGDHRARVSQALLQMLRLAALFGEQQPELAAAALYETTLQLEKQDQLPEAIRVRRELLDAHSQTYHGRLLAAEEKPTQTDTPEAEEAK